MERSSKSERIYDGRVINLRVDRVKLANGREAIREVVEHRGAAAIVPLLDDGKVVLVRQFRYATGADLLEIPAGTLEPNEKPEDCARRELEEETGYRAGELSKILECYVAPGYSTEKIHFFLARKMTRTKMRTEDDENIELEVISMSEAFARVRAGEIQDAKTICGLYRASELI